ncbi:MAG: tRNA-dihydrouridine(20/20a) synthase [Rhodomicrobium sp.]|nr:MAG: tRNA-dihydrouridine(20/20a) synthase [Rhodomicrobium sp.]
MEKAVKSQSGISSRLSVAPMMEWTDRHCRYFHRQITSQALLYTEMVTAEAIIHGPRERLLSFSAAEHPVALQLGGSDAANLRQAVLIANEYGYDEINLNVGCPSDRVQNGRFGACLMQEPETVRSCMEAMAEVATSPVTVKCRIGVDDMDDEKGLANFIETVSKAGVATFIIHARKAWLKGLSPKENREIPPLNYERVYRMKAERPDLTIILNGGVETVEAGLAHLDYVDGVMIGRAAYQNPACLSLVDAKIFGSATPPKTELEIAEAMRPYIEDELEKDTRLHHITRHMLGLFHGQPGARSYRRILSEQANQDGAGLEVFNKALNAINHVATDQPQKSKELQT